MLEEHLKCPICNNIYTHFVFTVEVRTKPDSNVATSVTVVGRRIGVQIVYPFRSQGILYLIYGWESGNYFLKSFDAIKGKFLTEENSKEVGMITYID